MIHANLGAHTRLLNPTIALLATAVFAANIASAEGQFGYNVELDVAYGKGVVRSDGGLVERDLLLDVYTPSANNADYTKTDAVAETLRPAVILVYGGGFQRGGRRQAPYTEFDAVHSRMEDYARLLTPLGYVIFVIEYRLAPELPEPTMALDAEWVVTMEEDLTDARNTSVCLIRNCVTQPWNFSIHANKWLLSR